MGRFAEEYHNDLPESMDRFCLNFRHLKAKLFRAEYDPYGDHPSIQLSERKSRVFVHELITELSEVEEFYRREGLNIENELRGLPSSYNAKDKISNLRKRVKNLFLFRILNFDLCGRLIDLHLNDIGFKLSEKAVRISKKNIEAVLLQNTIFGDTKLSSIKEQIERIYADSYCGSDVGVASTILEVSSLQSSFKSKSEISETKFFYLKLGASVVLFVWALWDVSFGTFVIGGHSLWSDSSYVLFRGLGNVILVIWAVNVCLRIWKRNEISYEKCFESVGKGKKIRILAIDASLAYLGCLILFNKMLRGSLFDEKLVPIAFAHSFPIILFLYVVQRIVTSLNEGLKPTMAYLSAVFSAPFGAVSFSDGFLGDVLTSTTRVAVDLAFALVFVGSQVFGFDSETGSSWFSRYLTPFLTLAPLWLRFLQCLRRVFETNKRWPNLANALKYAFALTVGSYGAARSGIHDSPLWVACFALATLYQFLWDVLMDWGLLCFDGGVAMRRQRVFPYKVLYLAASLFNFLLRFFWTVTIIPESSRSFLFTERFQSDLSPYVAAVEIVRRAVWAIFRVEYEHICMENESKKREFKGLEKNGADGFEMVGTMSFSKMEMEEVKSKRKVFSGDSGEFWRWVKSHGLLVELCVYACIMLAVVGTAFARC